MRAWAEQGLGISLLPEFAVSTALRSGTLAKLDFPRRTSACGSSGAAIAKTSPGYARSSMPQAPENSGPQQPLTG
jgi:DNA-binding transcriptional LysR family regulator